MAVDVSVLVLDGCTALASVGPMDILGKAGELHAQIHPGSRPFRPQKTHKDAAILDPSSTCSERG